MPIKLYLLNHMVSWAWPVGSDLPTPRLGDEVVREGELFQTPRRQKWVLLWTKYSQGLCCLVDLFAIVILKGPMPFQASGAGAYGQARTSGQEEVPRPLETEPPRLNVEQPELMHTPLPLQQAGLSSFQRKMGSGPETSLSLKKKKQVF